MMKSSRRKSEVKINVSRLRNAIKKKLFRKREDANDTEESSSCGSSYTEAERPQIIRVSSLLSGSAHRGTPIALDSDHDTQNQLSDSQSLVLEEDTESPKVLQMDIGSTEPSFTKPDVYGQAHPVETPELVSAKLVAFDKAVGKIPPQKRKGLDKAIEKCPELLDDKFKLMFLRCEVFNVKLAAKRYAKYWNMRIQIFGPERAFLPLTQKEALKDDLFPLSTGFVTLTNSRDFAGRHICFGNPEWQQIGAYPTESMVRAVWYIFHAALEDEDSQKRGIVFMADLTSARFSLLDTELVRLVAISAQGGLPMRISAIHGCSPPPIFKFILPILMGLMGERLRKRVRLHTVPIESLPQELAKYGLPLSALPTDIGGNIVLNHDGWLAERRRIEEA